MGLLAADAESGRVKSQLTQLPADLLPSDRRYNPAAMHPFVVSKSLAQTGNYTAPELVGAMEILLACNERLVSSSLEEDLVLQHALIRIIGPARERRS